MPVRSTIISRTAQMDARATISRPPSSARLCSKVQNYGYPCEEHKVTTEDGYILTLNRITKAGQPVLLQHGVLVDGMTWLVNGINQSLPLVLADRGYDVWIANTRGTRWSAGHVSLNPAQREYWEWTWDELVKFDLPSTFDYVYSHTGQKPALCWSFPLTSIQVELLTTLDSTGCLLPTQGTLIALAAFSQHKLVDKLRSAALLSPIAYLSHMTTPIGLSAAKSLVAEALIRLGLFKFDLRSEAVANILKLICAKAPSAHCYDMMTSFTGKNCCLNSSTVDVFLRNEPQPTSTKNMAHLAQVVRQGKITMYDYGKHENQGRYGQMEPPNYNMSSIPNDLPLFLSFGGQDALSDSLDVQLLLATRDASNRGDNLSVLFVQDYGHADFVMGTDAKHDVYDAVIEFFRRH